MFINIEDPEKFIGFVLHNTSLVFILVYFKAP